MSTKTVLLMRDYSNSKQTLGYALVQDERKNVIFSFLTLELPNLANKKNLSCIPEGFFKVVPRRSKKYGTHFHVLDVPNRSLILFHHGNYVTNTKGCILVGRTLKDLNSDGLLDVTNSLDTMKILLELCPLGFSLKIV